MWNNSYLESRVLSADPVELIGMLYEGAIEAVGDARRLLASGDIARRSRAITKAHAIVAELAGSLDHKAAGSLSRSLAELFDYIGRRLLEANFTQTDAPLAECLKLIGTLAEGWRAVPARDTGYGCLPLPVMAEAGEAHVWSA